MSYISAARSQNLSTRQINKGTNKKGYNTCIKVIYTAVLKLVLLSAIHVDNDTPLHKNKKNKKRFPDRFLTHRVLEEFGHLMQWNVK